MSRVMREVTLLVPDDADPSEVRSVIMDAFAEFVAARAHGDADVYVAQRYPNTAAYSWLHRAAKVDEVKRRIAIARALRGSA